MQSIEDNLGEKYYFRVFILRKILQNPINVS